MIFGKLETKDSLDFKNRVKHYHYTNDPCAKRRYQWSERKSSLLIQSIISDNLFLELTDFLYSILQLLTNNWVNEIKSEWFSFDKLFESYMSRVQTSVQKDAIDNYPICQPKAWLTDIEGAKRNFFVLYDFMKWIWILIKQGTFVSQFHIALQTPDNEYLSLMCLIEIFQQSTCILIDMIRGNRNEKQAKYTTDNVGISNIISNDLVRKVRGKSEYISQRWIHPGHELCEVPYLGGYGRELEKLANEDSFYYSLQCGISGSINYMIFMYLLTASGYPKNTFPLTEVDEQKYILSCIMILVGDGGHNAREVIFGLTTTIIILNTIINRVSSEFKKVYNKDCLDNNIKEMITHVTQSNFNTVKKSFLKYNKQSFFIKFCEKYSVTLKDINKIHKIENRDFINESSCIRVAHALNTWEIPVKRMYDYTDDINVTGLLSTDFSIDLKQNYDKLYENSVLWLLETVTVGKSVNLFDLIHNFQKNNNYNNVQVLMSLDNHRYQRPLVDSFDKIADEQLVDSILSFESGRKLLDDLNLKMEKDFTNCKTNQAPGNKVYDYPVEGVPFAFN